MHPSNTDHDETLKEQIDDILLKIGWKYFEELNGYRKESNFTIPMWSTDQEKSWDCISVGNYLELKELILQDRERAVNAGRIEELKQLITLNKTLYGVEAEMTRRANNRLAKLSNPTQEKD